LQRIHAQAPSLITWDDHEVSNDYADKWSQYYDDPELFLRRRAAVFHAEPVVSGSSATPGRRPRPRSLELPDAVWDD
jgi:hypothetical protein